MQSKSFPGVNSASSQQHILKVSQILHSFKQEIMTMQAGLLFIERD